MCLSIVNCCITLKLVNNLKTVLPRLRCFDHDLLKLPERLFFLFLDHLQALDQLLLLSLKQLCLLLKFVDEPLLLLCFRFELGLGHLNFLNFTAVDCLPPAHCHLSDAFTFKGLFLSLLFESDLASSDLLFEIFFHL